MLNLAHATCLRSHLMNGQNLDRNTRLLMAAWLLPLASFAVISIGYSVPQMLACACRTARMKYAAYVADRRRS